MRANINVLVGCSGSGKSTFAEKVRYNIEKNRITDCVIVSTDKLRGMLLGDESNQSNGKFIFDMAYLLVEEALYRGYDVIFDATNLTRAYRKPLIKLAQKYNAVPIAWNIECTEEEALERNRNRERHVPEEVISKQFHRLRKATEEEGFEFVIDVDDMVKEVVYNG